jgi:uncharacterized protein YbjT (DUF2867 family)
MTGAKPPPPTAAGSWETRDEGVDFSWFAADAAGNIGLFCAGREGFVPEDVQAHYQAHTQLVQEIEIPRRAEEQFGARFAAQGLFVYDWSGDENLYDFFVYRSPYHKVAEPMRQLDADFQTRVLQLTGLPMVREDFHAKFSVSADEFLPRAEPKTALIAGASGLIGSQLLPLLLAAGRYAKVIAVGRRPLPIVHPKLEQRILDFDQLEEHRLGLIADDVYCCLGTTIRQAGSKEAFYTVDYLYVVKLAALTAGNFAVQLLVVSAIGADAHSRLYYNRVKGEMEDAVRQTPFRAVYLFRPSLLLGERSEQRTGERLGAMLLRVLRPVLQGPLRRYRAIAAADVARAMLQAAGRDVAGIQVYASDRIEALSHQPA